MLLNDETRLDDGLKTQIRAIFLRDLVARTKLREEIRKAAVDRSKRVIDLEAFHDGCMDGMIDVMCVLDRELNDAFGLELQAWKTAGSHFESVSEKLP